MLFFLSYIVPFLISSICYIFLIYKDWCRGHLFGWILCICPMINLAWAVIMVTGCLEYFWNQQNNHRRIA